MGRVNGLKCEEKLDNDHRESNKVDYAIRSLYEHETVFDSFDFGGSARNTRRTHSKTIF